MTQAELIIIARIIWILIGFAVGMYSIVHGIISMPAEYTWVAEIVLGALLLSNIMVPK